MKLTVVAGARPNFMKIAPIMWEIARRPGVTARLVHTGQHYDEKMSKLFFEQLRIPKPAVDLEVGSGSHAVQTAEAFLGQPGGTGPADAVPSTNDYSCSACEAAEPSFVHEWSLPWDPGAMRSWTWFRSAAC